ncbi:MAG: hypothetical protein A2664_01225 [Candidatus Taylorbacteria bacterium RIFCSPHIGHO2_01_FULL_46_22b]|uniref:Uncharacterized protein n=1 Tax=Candidatus Taylorbacteria bacterium RIFCSPHIGHO2_01_FULL_46_22b TaxID=1802301 RepID=A0A1G2M233_9BACT|nr:MAG: hypothetical protein A2664_01225 [Candidatus Taylorbacteria bacterium RIFCSPHIGHO2_01_FULL_46_22b]
MDAEKRKLLDEKFYLLAKPLQDVILDEDEKLETTVDLIVQKYKLELDTARILDDEIVMVLGGFTNPKDFIRALSGKLGTDASKAPAIAQEINEKIFRAVKDDLQNLYGLPIPKQPQQKPSLATELEEDVGLRKQLEQAKSAEQKRPLSAVLQDALRAGGKETESGITNNEFREEQNSKFKIQNSANEIEPLRTMERDMESVRHTGTSRPRPAFIPPTPRDRESGITNNEFREEQLKEEKPPVPPKPPASTPFTQSPRLPVPPPPRAPRQEPAEEPEEQLSREDILRGIEDPSSIPRDRTNNSPVYNADPYREPTE